MSKFAAGTEVPVERSRAEIERTITRFGATHTAFMTAPNKASIAFVVRERRVRFDISLPDLMEGKFWKTPDRKLKRNADGARKAWEAECRQRWRALCLVIKAKLEAVESGITEFEDEFLAHIVMADGRTASEHVRPWIARSYESFSVPALPSPQ